ncbi:hypothetical protein HYX17_01490 [Candidatus Woesearchaeota archaeon]|nr:hypothetical protein [Candidatus Woesearchaeota archaeon]
MNKSKLTLMFCILFLIVVNIALGYKMEPNREVHQYTVKEAAEVWKLMPKEIKDQSISYQEVGL